MTVDGHTSPDQSETNANAPVVAEVGGRGHIGLIVLGSIACYFVPQRKTPFQLAALTAALLLGFELTLTHWFYLYIPWFFPFVALVVLASRARPELTAPPPSDSPTRELVTAG